jgi:hypothetical protein
MGGNSKPSKGLALATSALAVGKQQVRLSQAYFEDAGNDYSHARANGR